MFLPVFFPEKQSTTYRIKFFNVSKKIVNSLSLQKPRACKTKSFFKAITCVPTWISTCTFCHCLLRVISALYRVRLVWRPQVKLKLLQIRFWDYCNFLPRLNKLNEQIKRNYHKYEYNRGDRFVFVLISHCCDFQCLILPTI